MRYLASTATDIAALGAQLQTDVISWGYAAIAVALAATAVLWIKRLLGH
jgi:hypothetical protein